MSEDVTRAYDAISGSYDALHLDWRASVGRQGLALDGLMEQRIGVGPHRVLDCSCGIGTQAIGLAVRGHAVTGTDLSSAALERARAESASFGVELETQVADMRELQLVLSGPFDVVLSCDNSIAHLDPAELGDALAQMHALTRPGGLVLVSLRDYGSLRNDRARLASPMISGAPGTRSITLQAWEWDAGGVAYRSTLLFLDERDGAWTIRSEMLPILHAHERDTMIGAMEHAGLDEVRWHDAGDDAFYQPVATALRRARSRGVELR